MLAQLSIKNYALIDDLSVSFFDGFTTITGETGAGKSILLGGLSLVLGKRADLSSLRDHDKKCIIEAEFEIEKYKLESFFIRHDLEYENRTVIRREIYPGGKSRAFINDSPVVLDLLSKLGKNLVDVHSQHQTLQLTEQDFQMHVLDALGGNISVLKQYQTGLEAYLSSEKELVTLIEQRKNALKDEDYNRFLHKELQEANLEKGMAEKLEEEFEQLNHVETILENLSGSNQLLNDEQIGLVSLLLQLKQLTSKISDYGDRYQGIYRRVESMLIELDDLGAEIQELQESIEPNPELLEETANKLKTLHDLQQKHTAIDVEALIVIRDALAQNLDHRENLDDEIAEKEAELSQVKKDLDQLATKLSQGRQAVIPIFTEKMEAMLGGLGMPNASFNIRLLPAEGYQHNGCDNLMFLFSANKGMEYGNIKKVASGGELSRIMLVIKSILAEFEDLPTLMFDEIDSGVSGEISNAMADIMFKMSRNMQVFSITHLPQVASKGLYHYKVFKVEGDTKTDTRIKMLEPEQRIVELAEMLGGKDLSESAIAHARELLN